MQPATPAPPGWYADPTGLPCQRWWDGNTWLDQTRPLATERATEADDHRNASRRNASSRRARIWVGAGIAAAVAVGAVVTAMVVPSGGDSSGGTASSASSSDARAQSELRSGVLAVEQCFADSGQYPASVTTAGKDGPLVLNCGGQTETVELSADDVASLASTATAYVLEVGSATGTRIYTYDSTTGTVTQRPRNQ